jgi:hypothetical protein
MASKRKSCEGKKKFPDLVSANAARYLIMRDSGNKMWAYKCKFCNSYHLGHPSKRILQSIRAIMRRKHK